MSAVESPKVQSIQYPQATVQRAELALRCSPFQLKLLATMANQSVPLVAIASQEGVQNSYTRSPLSELAVENHLLWFIQVGLLRREVDGQGITDSFRLTPLGRQLMEKWQAQGGWPAASFGDRFYLLINRWFRLPY